MLSLAQNLTMLKTNYCTRIAAVYAYADTKIREKTHVTF